MAKSKMKRKRSPKHVLKLPYLEQSKSAVLNSLTSRSSQRTYDHAPGQQDEWLRRILTPAFCKVPNSRISKYGAMTSPVIPCVKAPLTSSTRG